MNWERVTANGKPTGRTVYWRLRVTSSAKPGGRSWVSVVQQADRRWSWVYRQDREPRTIAHSGDETYSRPQAAHRAAEAHLYRMSVFTPAQIVTDLTPAQVRAMRSVSPADSPSSTRWALTHKGLLAYMAGPPAFLGVTDLGRAVSAKLGIQPEEK